MPAKRPPTSAKFAKPSESPARILVVDDEEGVRFTFRQTLARAGYQVQTASNGEEGLGLLQKQSYDLVLLDLKMPGMDGVEFMRRLRGLKRRPEVLVISGYATLENAVEVVKLGAFDVAQKPCLSGDLLPRVERILARRREPVVAYVRANFATIGSREEVARHFHISDKTLSNRIKRYTGQSFSVFLTSCRLQEAQRILVETDLDVGQVAQRVGFQSLPAFDHAFHRLTGHYPLHYRTESRSDQA